MKYHQRDIVEVSFLFPDGTFKPHPAIIVSNDQLQEDEDGMFYLVLITSNDWLNPQYSYPLSDDMVDGFTFSKPSLVKCQIITGPVTDFGLQAQAGVCGESIKKECVTRHDGQE